jgi:hypothetical protein
MRYRLDNMPLAESMVTTEDVHLFTVIISFFIGIFLTWLGFQGRQIWLTVWSAGLVAASGAYLGFIAWGTH